MISALTAISVLWHTVAGCCAHHAHAAEVGAVASSARPGVTTEAARGGHAGCRHSHRHSHGLGKGLMVAGSLRDPKPDADERETAGERDTSIWRVLLLGFASRSDAATLKSPSTDENPHSDRCPCRDSDSCHDAKCAFALSRPATLPELSLQAAALPPDCGAAVAAAGLRSADSSRDGLAAVWWPASLRAHLFLRVLRN